MNNDLATIIVEEILNDLHGRKGVGDELDAIEEDVYLEMKQDLIQIVVNPMRGVR